MPNPEPIEIARPGRAVDTAGRKHDITPAMLAEIASSYDPGRHEAPLVIGHPKHDDPAFGWVKSLTWDGTALRAEPRDVVPQFAEAVTQLRTFPKRSPSFYPPGHPSNPTPGKWSLRHVGFLGAAPPAIKGLKDVVSFADGAGEQDLVTLEFGEWSDKMIARALRSLRDFFIGEFGQEKADRALPPWTVDEVQEDTARDAVAQAAAFAESTGTPNNQEASSSGTPASTTPAPVGNPPAGSGAEANVAPGNGQAPQTGASQGSHQSTVLGGSGVPAPAEATPVSALGSAAPGSAGAGAISSPDISSREAELVARERRLAEREAELAKKDAEQAAAAKAARTAEHLAFCEGLVAAGRPLPVPAPALVAFMHRLEGDVEPELVSFGEGDERSSLEFFRNLLSAIPSVVNFSELSGGSHDGELTVGERAARIETHRRDAEARGQFMTTAQAAIQLKDSGQL